LQEAIALGHIHVGTEHILLGLVRENEGVAAHILVDFDADPERIRNEILRTFRGGGAPRAALASAAFEEVELTSPPLAPEVVAELVRLECEKQAAIERQSFDEAARLRDAERRLRPVAALLVRAWRRHIDELA